MKQSPDLAAASAALKRLDWKGAALRFSAAADAAAAGLDQHGTASATEISLRRSAHLALCRTREFLKHRERARRGRQDVDFSHEWREPSGALVESLLGQHARVTP